MLILQSPQGVYVEKRPESGIWGGLWSFPEFDNHESLLAWCDQRGAVVGEERLWEPLRHTFSHFHLDITPCQVCMENPVFSVMEADSGLWYNTGQS